MKTAGHKSDGGSESLQSTSSAMRLSLVIGFLMLVIKMGAYLVTGSSAVLGDAAESVVHVAAVMFATFSLWLSTKPPDENHRYGHSKIAFFSAGTEGLLIILAAVYIVHQSLAMLIAGSGPGELGKGIILTAATIVINGVLGAYLISIGRRHHSLILISNGKHVLTDSWTSLGAIGGLVLVYFSGWSGWDPVFGLIMAANILVSGYGLVRESVSGLMDVANPEHSDTFKVLFERETQSRGVSFHALRHRDSGLVHWVDVHLLFPDDISLKEAHRTATEIELAVGRAFHKPVRITTHLECEGDHDDLHPDEDAPK
jgi:cation diffusion facilitator family transporter